MNINIMFLVDIAEWFPSLTRPIDQIEEHSQRSFAEEAEQLPRQQLQLHEIGSKSSNHKIPERRRGFLSNYSLWSNQMKMFMYFPIE